MGVAGGGTNVATGARGPDVMGLGAPLLLPLVAAMYAIAATMARGILFTPISMRPRKCILTTGVLTKE